MKISPVKINTITPKKPTSIKDALIVSGYCALPVALYEAARLLAKKLNNGGSDTFEYQ